MFILYQHYYEQYETGSTWAKGLYTTLELAEAAKAICESNPVDDYYIGSLSWTITEMAVDVMPKVVQESEVNCYYEEEPCDERNDWREEEDGWYLEDQHRYYTGQLEDDRKNESK